MDMLEHEAKSLATDAAVVEHSVSVIKICRTQQKHNQIQDVWTDLSNEWCYGMGQTKCSIHTKQQNKSACLRKPDTLLKKCGE